MLNFFRSLHIDRLSFWIGFATASLFWWLFVQLWPSIYSLLKRALKKIRTARQGAKVSTSQRHRIDTLQYAQSLHLANQLFALDEILVAPRLLAPPLPAQPGKISPTEDIVTQSVPYLPDWPELGTIYRAHTLSITDALSGGSNLAIIGHPGSGKTVALAVLASMSARRELKDPDLHNRIPVLIHAADLIFTNNDEQDHKSIIDILAQAVLLHTSGRAQSRTPEYLAATFSSGDALLIIDGMDELPSTLLKTTVNFIEQLMRQYPSTRAVVATAPKHLDRLPALDFVPMPMAYWSQIQQAQYVQKWGAMWVNFIDTNLETQEDQYESINPLLLNGWLLNQEIVKSPLSFMLQVWAVYAGDVRGISNTDAIDAYLRRMSINIPQAQETLNQLAVKSVTLMQATFTEKEAKQWSSEENHELLLDRDDDAAIENIPAAKGFYNPKVLPELIHSGILIFRADKRLSFVHPEFVGYLAGRALDYHENDEIFTQPHWALQHLTLHYLASHRNISDQVQLHQTQLHNQDPLMTGQLSAGRWLRDIPLAAPWRKPILQKLIRILQDDNQTMGVRASALSALISSNDPSLIKLFQHLVNSQKTSVRRLAALGMGTQHGSQSISSLIHLLQDYPEVSRAACLALVSLGTQPALEAVANALIQGNEDVRKAAAEAFANHPTAGYPTLQEGAVLDDLLVRRAVIYGLQRIREPWTLELLDKIQIEDSQWVVKNAAAQAFEELHQPDPRIPKPLLSLADTPWLISFAADRDLGVSPGKPAHEMMLRALDEGTTTEQLATLQQFQRRGNTDIFPAIYNLLYSDSPDLSEAAYVTLWTLSATGFELPHPLQFGFG